MLIFAPMDLPKLLLHWQLILFLFFCFFSLLQIAYYVFIFSRLAYYSPATKQVTQAHPVSVIICARDEAGNLANNLPGALVQAYRYTHEVVVVNDNSFDDSKYVLEALRKTYKQLQVVELTQEAKMIPGKKFPLSVGIKTAKHEILLLTDADCVPATENWIENMQGAYEEGTEIVLGYGAFHKKKGWLNKLVRWETFHSALQYFSYALAGLPYMGVGRNLSYKKSVFFRHKGFSAHNHIPGGDDDLFINKAATSSNTRINIDKESYTLSKPAATWAQWYRQKTRHYTTSRMYKPLHKILLGTYSLTHFFYYPLFIITLFYRWDLALSIFCVRLMLQTVVIIKSMKKLGEKDLIPYFLLFDIWMFFYYLIFATSLVKKPRPTWK